MGSATLADIGSSSHLIVRDTDTPSGDVCPHGRASLLENGTEESQKPVRAITSVIASQCTETDDNIRLGASRQRGQLPPSRLSDLNGPPGPEISMESLILAQDERWRRA